MAEIDKTKIKKFGFTEDEDGSLRYGDMVIPPPPVATLSHDVPEKRLIITELWIKNFKSYANEIILEPFDKNFTAVVGPNGSGKSNVIDALLFVFGYRAKKIRSKKVSHLIHRSERYPNVSSCSVTVKFALINEDGEEYLPGTSFSLSRTAFQDDSSFYQINNKRVPYKEIVVALRQYGIDLEHSRFLILQGEIEAISLMNPKAQNEHETGMLEYVEDIIGSNRYINPIAKFYEELEKLNTEKKEKLNILRLVEKEKDALEQPKNKAIEYLRLDNQLVLNENSLLQYRRHTAEKELENVVGLKRTASEKLNQIKDEINTFKATRKAQEEQLDKISRELDVHVKNLEKFKESYKGLERKDVQISEEIKHLKSKKSKLESTLSTTETELTKLKKQLETYEKETTELIEAKEKCEAEKVIEEKKQSEVMEMINKETPILQQEQDKLEAVLVKRMKELHNLQSEKDIFQSQLNMLTKTNAKENEKLSNLISNHKKAEKNANEEETLLKKEQQQIVDLQKEYDDLLLQIKESQQKEVALSEELKSTSMKLAEANSSLSNYQTRNSAIQALNKERAKGRLSGVLGRLGDLGAIDIKYDIAISTAAPQLDYVVTDNMDTAQMCVEFLKRSNSGYTTFIALDKQQHLWPEIRKQCRMPENVPRLVDLIRVNDEKLLPAFYYVLRDTLVAQDLEQATRIGFQGTQRHRVVTLNGEMIEKSGTMSGGGGRVAKGRMGQTVVECTHTPEEVAKLKNDKALLTNEVSAIRRSILNLQEQVSQKTKELSGLKLSVRKRQSNYKAYLDNAETLKSQIEEQKDRVKNSTIDEDEVLDLKNKIMQREKSCIVSAEETSAIKKKISKLQDEILKITKGSMGKVTKSVEQLNKKLQDHSANITKSTVNAKNCRKNMKKAEEKKKNAEKELIVVKETKVKLTAERENCVSQARELLTKQEEAQTAVDELKSKKMDLKKSLEGFLEQEHQLKLAEITHKNEIKEHEVIESEKRSLLKSIAIKMGKLKLNEVEKDSTEIPVLSGEEIEKLSVKRLLSEIELLKMQLEEIRPDLSAIEEFKKQEKICNEKQKDFDDIVQQRNLQHGRYEELRKLRLAEFMQGFTVIAKKLKEIYQMLTLGGDAEMELVDTFDPFSKGVEFSVRPPRKSWKFMRNLSGGEKTLSSLALVFALHYYRHTPFYVMDEIDAALDVRNVAIVGFFLKERQKNTQFIIVSLRNIMNELADHLIGIFKTGNTSKNVSLRGASKWKEEDQEEEQQSSS